MPSLPPLPITSFLPSFYAFHPDHRRLHPSELTSHGCFLNHMMGCLYWMNLSTFLFVYIGHIAMNEIEKGKG